MHIYIPSLSREKIPYTYNSIIAECPYPVSIVVRDSQYAQYKAAIPEASIIATPADLPNGIGPTRQWIRHTLSADNVDDKFISMDDDLTFAVRRTDDPTKFRDPQRGEIEAMFYKLNDMLDDYAHISVATREGGHRQPEPVIHFVRAMRTSGYRRSALIKAGVDHRESTVIEDFEVTLALLTKGYPNATLNTHVQNQKGSNSAGGASEYRTMEVQRLAAEKLRSRYPDFVRTVEKTTKTAWGGATRTDMIIQWKKALAYGIATYGEQKL
jgi:hypothetical protein